MASHGPLPGLLQIPQSIETATEVDYRQTSNGWFVIDQRSTALMDSDD
jgi:hypothetical protein